MSAESRTAKYEQSRQMAWTFLRSLCEATPINSQLSRQFACECCRAVENLFPGPELLESLTAIERFARGEATFDALSVARKLARTAVRRAHNRQRAAAMAICWAATNNHFMAGFMALHYAARAGLDAKALEQICDRFRRKPG